MKTLLNDIKIRILGRRSKLWRLIEENISYVGDWREVTSGLLLENLSNQIETRTGDCKFISALMIAALRDLGVTAYPFLVEASEIPVDIDSRVPSEWALIIRPLR